MTTKNGHGDASRERYLALLLPIAIGDGDAWVEDPTRASMRQRTPVPIGLRTHMMQML